MKLEEHPSIQSNSEDRRRYIIEEVEILDLKDLAII